jgi:putative addiction module component (TIGR02574 family)
MNTLNFDYESLPVSARIQLVEDIWDSIPAQQASDLGLSDEQFQVLNQRFAAHQSQPQNSYTLSQVRGKLFGTV